MSAKRWCKETLIALARHQHSGASHRVVVLCYHSIHQTNSFRSATPELFKQHLRWFKENCEVIRFSQIFESPEAERRNRPAVALTFDDGNADNYECAFPLLEEHAIRATFFLTVGLLENDTSTLERFREQRRSRHEDIRPLGWPEVCEMRRAGMDIGAHTFSHPNLAQLDRRSVEMEVKCSKETLEQRLGEQITLMAYPFGRPTIHFRRETVDVVAEAGYKLAAALLSRPVRPDGPRLAIPRFLVENDDIETLRDKVFGAWDLFGLLQEIGFRSGWLG